jgi:hypothetical protein
MPHSTSFPRICIAMGFPDAQKLLEHARRYPEVSRRALGLSHPGHLPASSESWKI